MDIDVLKKYKRNILILKIVALILFVFILSFFGIVIINKVQQSKKAEMIFEQSEQIHNILEQAYTEIENIKSGENYSLIENNIRYDNNNNKVSEYIIETLYKNGFFKEECKIDNSNYKNNDNDYYRFNQIFLYNTDVNDDYIHYINYGMKTENRTSIVQFDKELNYKGGIGTVYEGTKSNILDNYYKENVVDYNCYEISEKEYEGIWYYVIRENLSNTTHTDIWINRDNNQLFKIINERVGKSKEEIIYRWSINNVKDEDVRVKYIEKYKTNERMLELDSIFEKLINGEEVQISVWKEY